ncbi:MAG: tetratricopeptide repeat protein [Bacteroidota bacterium]
MSAFAISHTPQTSSSPILLLARANTSKDPKKKKALVKECEMITSLFRQSSDYPFHLILAQPETGEFLFDHLRKYRFKEQPIFLHIAGYPGGQSLQLEGGWGEESLKPKEFARLLSRISGLEMVFLNGCATPALLEELLLLDIPAVLVLAESKGRRFNAEIAHAMYEGLARGMTLQEAFQHTQKSYAHVFAFKRVFYHLEKDQLIWDGREKAMKRNELEWGMYVLDENRVRLEENFHSLPGLPQDNSEHEHEKKQARRSRRIVSAMLALGLMGTMLFLLGQHPQIQQLWSSYHQTCSFESATGFNILQHPFYEAGNCDHSDPFYSRSISRRIQQLEGSYEHQLSSLESCTISLSEAERSLRSCEADLVLWGTYAFEDAQSATIRFRYLYTGYPTILNHGEREMRMPLHLFDQENDFIYSAVEDMIFWTEGMGQAERGEYETAISTFQKIRKTEEADYYLVDMQLARCYLHLKNFEQARVHLDHLLFLEPTHTDSWYERGNIHLRLGNYTQARKDLDRAIELQEDYADAYYSRGLLNLKTHQIEAALSDGTDLLNFRPDEGRTHGLLAIIYAEADERSQAIEHLEKGLKRGLEASGLFSAIPSLQQFETDPEVQALLTQYQ